MTSHIMRLDYLCADAIYMVLEIWKRMGWQFDKLDEEMRTRVNVPIDDLEMFEFIMNSLES